MASQVSIVNMALSMLGADRITALTDNTENARRMNAIYDETLKDLLRMHPWNFAIGRASLAKLSTAPLFEYDCMYQLPPDCLRVISVNDGSNIIEDFKIEGRQLITDETTVYIKYIKEVGDPNELDANFRNLFSARLAADLGYAITNNKATAEQAYALYEKKLEFAKQADSQESFSTEEIDKDLWTIDQRS